MASTKEGDVKTRNLVAKHSPHRAATHKDRKRATKRVRGSKHKSKES
jgi:hypothetical protein